MEIVGDVHWNIFELNYMYKTAVGLIAYESDRPIDIIYMFTLQK